MKFDVVANRFPAVPPNVPPTPSASCFTAPIPIGVPETVQPTVFCQTHRERAIRVRPRSCAEKVS